MRKDNPNLEGGEDQLIRLIVKVMTKLGVSYLDGLNTRECIYWWNYGVLLGKDILEGFENYFSANLTLEFARCRKKTLRDTRWEVEEMIKHLRH